MLEYFDSQPEIAKLSDHAKMSATSNGVNLLKSRLDQVQAKLRRDVARLDIAIAEAKGRLDGDSRKNCILRAGNPAMILPEYPVVAALMANSHKNKLRGMPVGTYEEHMEALRMTYTWMCFISTREPELLLHMGERSAGLGGESAGQQHEHPQVEPAEPVPAVPADRTCKKCGKTFTNTKIRDTHVAQIHDIQLTPAVYDGSNPACWEKARCGYSACKLKKAAGHTTDGCGSSLNPTATRTHHKALVDKWGSADKRRNMEVPDDGVVQGGVLAHIVVCALNADTASKRHLSNHGQHRAVERGSTEFGGLRAAQARFIKDQVARILELEKARAAADTFLVERISQVNDQFFGHMMGDVIPMALAWWNRDNHSGRKRRREKQARPDKRMRE